MHYYACPYCRASEGGILVRTKMEQVKCKYDKEEHCEEKHKCKEVMQCKECKSTFKITKVFLSEQKRKIKDG